MEFHGFSQTRNFQHINICFFVKRRKAQVASVRQNPQSRGVGCDFAGYVGFNGHIGFQLAGGSGSRMDGQSRIPRATARNVQDKSTG